MTEDGEKLTSQVWSPKGDPENGLSWEDVETKFRTLTDGYITTKTQDKVIEICKNFESQENVAELFEEINLSFQTSY